MSELEDDLKSTGEAIRGDADRLKQIEEAKAALDADDPRVVELSEDAQKMAHRVHRETMVESHLADRVASDEK
jgi:hypothetical protein